jgi:hypothetical protein
MDKVKEKLNYLYEMLEKYNVLNSKTNYEYKWRVDGIQEKIEVLEDVLNNVTNEYDECYQEDLEESKNR